MDRRSFLRSTAIAAGVTALGPAFWRNAYAATALPGAGPYGGLRPVDANGVMLPAGFTSRVLAVTGQVVVGTSYLWHAAPDGGAVFPQDDGGWVYTSNSEVPFVGGAGALRFGPDGEVVDAYRLLTGTSLNCAGGPTPWDEAGAVSWLPVLSPTLPQAVAGRPAGSMAFDDGEASQITLTGPPTPDPGTASGVGVTRVHRTTAVPSGSPDATP